MPSHQRFVLVLIVAAAASVFLLDDAAAISPFPPRSPRPPRSPLITSTCAAFASIAPTVSAGATSNMNAAFAKNASHTKSNSGKKTVLKDGVTYNVDYSMTIYGYNDITANVLIEDTSCTATTDVDAQASGTFAITLMWQGATPSGTGVEGKGSAKVYGTLCVPGVCTPAYTIPGVCSPEVCTPESCCCGGCCCKTCAFGSCCCKTCVSDTCIPAVCVPGVCSPDINMPAVCSPEVCTPDVLLTTAPISFQVSGLNARATGTYVASSNLTEICFTFNPVVDVTMSENYVDVYANGEEKGDAENTAMEKIDDMGPKLEASLFTTISAMGTKCQPWTPGGSSPDAGYDDVQ